MPDAHSRKNLADIHDVAPDVGLAEWQESRFAAYDLGATETGIAYHRIKPGTRQGFAHRHEHAQEFYVVLKGSGRVKLDDDILDLKPLDVLRVDAQVLRTWEAGPDGLELLAFGPHHGGDAEFVQNWWQD